VPYYVEQHFDYPRFVCYDCHAYASYQEWDPYRSACARYRVVIRDDPEYYPYRYGGRNVVAGRPLHLAPRFVFRDADPGRPAVIHGESERRRDDRGRTSDDVGGPGSVPAPRVQSLRRRDELAPEASPTQPSGDPRRRVGRRSEPETSHEPRAGGASSGDVPDGLRPTSVPQSIGEPELRRRSP